MSVTRLSQPQEPFVRVAGVEINMRISNGKTPMKNSLNIAGDFEMKLLLIYSISI